MDPCSYFNNGMTKIPNLVPPAFAVLAARLQVATPPQVMLKPVKNFCVDLSILNVRWPLIYFLYSLFLKQVKEKRGALDLLSLAPLFSARLQLLRAWNRHHFLCFVKKMKNVSKLSHIGSLKSLNFLLRIVCSSCDGHIWKFGIIT